MVRLTAAILGLCIPLLALYVEPAHAADLVPRYDKDTKKWGYVDADSLKVIIHAEYDYCGPFVDKFPALVTKSEKFFFINRDGKNAFEQNYEFAGEFRSGLASVKQDGKYGLIDTNGRFVVAAKYELLGNNSASLIRFRANKKYGFINLRGEEVIRAEYDLVGEFSEGRAWVKYQGKYGFIDIRNSFIVRPEYDAVGDFSCGLAPVKKNGLFGYINRDGSQAIKPQYEAIRPFTKVTIGNGVLAATRLNGKWGVIDRTNKVLMKHEGDGVGVGAGGSLSIRVGDFYSVIAGVTDDNELLMEKAIVDVVKVEIKSKPLPVEIYCVEKYLYDKSNEETLLTPMNRLPEGDPSAPPEDDPKVTATLNKNKAWVIIFVKRAKDGSIATQPRVCHPGVDNLVKVVFP